MNIFGYLILIVLALNAGFVIGAWWASRPKPEEDEVPPGYWDKLQSEILAAPKFPDDGDDDASLGI